MIASLYLLNSADPKSAQAVGWIFLGLITIIGGIILFLKLADRIRGSKPDATDLQTFATKAELQEVKGDVDKLEKRFEKTEEDSKFQNFATQRALGRIEGELKNINSNK